MPKPRSAGRKRQDAMQGQLDVMKADHRPWVGLSSIVPNPDASSTIAVKNAGKSPAMNVRVKIFGHTDEGKPISVPAQPCSEDCTFHNIEMLPDIQLSDRVPRTDKPLPQAGTALWLGIRADYEDAEGSPHKTGVCLIQKSPGKLSTCPISR